MIWEIFGEPRRPYLPLKPSPCEEDRPCCVQRAVAHVVNSAPPTNIFWHAPKLFHAFRDSLDFHPPNTKTPSGGARETRTTRDYSSPIPDEYSMPKKTRGLRESRQVLTRCTVSCPDARSIPSTYREPPVPRQVTSATLSWESGSIATGGRYSGGGTRGLDLVGRIPRWSAIPQRGKLGEESRKGI